MSRGKLQASRAFAIRTSIQILHLAARHSRTAAHLPHRTVSDPVVGGPGRLGRSRPHPPLGR